MKILAAHQPAFMPWLGYLDRIRQADVFVVLAGVQFEKNSYINRNQIMLDGQPHWLTVPLKMKGHMGRSIAEMEVEQTRPWRKKHLNTIRHAYSKAPRFAEKWPHIKELYEEYLSSRRFIEVFANSLMLWLTEYGMGEKMEELKLNLSPTVKTEELIALCRHHECDTYLSGPFGRKYLDMEAFEKAGIEVRFHEPDFPPISVLHSWMNNHEVSWSLPLTQTMKSSDAVEQSSGM